VYATAVVGLFVGSLHLFLLINACVFSLSAAWPAGVIAGALRAFLLVALTMAKTRIRLAGVDPTPAFFAAIGVGPALSTAVAVASQIRLAKMPQSESRRGSVARAAYTWTAAALIDATLFGIAIVSMASQSK